MSTDAPDATNGSVTWNGTYVQLGGLPFAADSDYQIRGFVTQSHGYTDDTPSSMSFAWTDRMYCFHRGVADGASSPLYAADMNVADNKNFIEYCVSYKAVS